MRVLIIFLFLSAFSFGQDNVFYITGSFKNADTVECHLFGLPDGNVQGKWQLIEAKNNVGEFAVALDLNESFLLIFAHTGWNKFLLVHTRDLGHYEINLDFALETKYAIIQPRENSEGYTSFILTEEEFDNR